MRHPRHSELFPVNDCNHGTVMHQAKPLYLQDQMRQLLRDMREPQRGLKVVHIAGTKGKGSTATMLSSILHQSGLKVGTYTRQVPLS